MNWKELELSGWGRSRRVRTQAARPERVRDVIAAMGEADEKGIIAYGAGRSYGDAALNDGGRTILTGRLNRILTFDSESGEMVAEPGVTFRELIDVFLPRGYLPPACPGTAYTTLGGAVANDVHGKNHESAGSFGDHVVWFELVTPAGERVRCSPQDNADLFFATIGGLGLTGVIVTVCLRLKRVPSNALVVRHRRMADIEAFLAAFAVRDADSEYSVGWIDGLAGGKQIGRGVLQTARPADQAVTVKPHADRLMPFDLPEMALNRWTVAAFNALYLRRVPAAGTERLTPCDSFLFPLDSLLEWNRIYGRRGFHQFQCVVPEEGAAIALRLLLGEVVRSRRASFLAVLKRLGAAGLGFLSFPMPGYTLALDFPNRAGVEGLLQKLERITLDRGGRVYLAKDSSLTPAALPAMYPELAQFRAVLETVDPRARMQSDMARRLKLREAGA
jgi:decaprenylphospho-beta-D-ribofuranose 2-oxidase